MRISLIVIFVFTFQTSFAQPAKEKLFAQTVKSVVDAFSKQDSAALAKFINNNEGIYLLHRVGVFDQYNHYRTIAFSGDYPQGLLTGAKGARWMPLQYSALPSFNCNSEKWSKTGLFVDTTKTNHLLSQLCENRNKNRPDTISLKTINQFRQLESISRRIVLQDEHDKEIVFYLSYINGRWYLTVIDKVTSDCSV